MNENTPPATPAKEIEEGVKLMPKFDEKGLITAAVSAFDTGELLMVAHMNQTALDKTLETGQAWFWSRSRGKLWLKGETSGAVLKVKEMRIDCDQDAVWLRVEAQKSQDICHTGRKGCFYRRVVDDSKTKYLVIET